MLIASLWAKHEGSNLLVGVSKIINTILVSIQLKEESEISFIVRKITV